LSEFPYIAFLLIVRTYIQKRSKKNIGDQKDISILEAIHSLLRLISNPELCVGESTRSLPS